MKKLNDKIKKDIICQNCKRPLKGDENFCPYCGQKNDIRPLSIKHFFKYFFDNFISFDSRLHKTIFYLIKNPGKLSLEYINGKRISYTNPFKLMLNLGIIYFLLINLLNIFFSDNDTTNISLKNNASVYYKANKTTKNRIDSLVRENNYTEIFNSDKYSDKHKDSIIKNIINILKAKDTSGLTNEINNYLNLEEYFKQKKIKYDYKLFYSIKKSINNTEDINKTLKPIIYMDGYNNLSVNELIDSIKLDNSIKNKLLLTSMIRLKKFTGHKDEINKFIRNLYSSITIALFFVLPFFAFFVNIIYYKSGHSYTTNLILIFNIQSLFFLLSIFFIPFSYFSNSDFSILFRLIIYSIYVFISLRSFYKQNIRNTIIKIIATLPFYLIFIGIGVTIVSVVTFLFD